MSEDKPLTGLKKRQQITDTRKQVFYMVAIASAIVVIGIVASMKVFNAINYQLRINGALAETADIMHDNVSRVDKLISKVNTLKTNKLLSMTNLKDNDSTVFQIVIDSLPTEDDRVALSSSLQNKILFGTGATIEQINIDQDRLATSSSLDASSDPGFPIAKKIPFKAVVKGGYEEVQQALKNIEKTIRPIQINKLTIEGSGENLTMTIDAVTYYSSNVDFKLG